MSIADLLENLGRYDLWLILYFCLLPACCWLYTRMLAPGRGVLKPHRYIFAVLIYLSCVPGMFAAVITGYSLLMTRTNLLQVNMVLYFLPIASMVATLVFIRQKVDTRHIPGFDRLLGLCMLLGVTFIILLMLMKTRIFLFFGAPMIALVVFVLILFLLLKWATHRLFRQKNDPPNYPR